MLKREKSEYHGFVWLEQNPNKQSEWGALARAGHEVYHLVSESGAFRYGGRIMIDGYIFDSYADARMTFAKKGGE